LTSRTPVGPVGALFDEAAQLVRLARFALGRAGRDTRRPSPVPESPRFASARAAVARIPDGAVVAVSGLGAQQRASVLYRAIRESFLETGHPRGLTLVNIGGHGSRGLLPGTLDELALEGLCARLVTSHFETFHGFLALAARGRCELQCVPLGVLAGLYAGQARGEVSLASVVGLGTFLDPRCGRGSAVGGRSQRAPWGRPREAPGGRSRLALDGRSREGLDGRSWEGLVRPARGGLRYRLPPIDVALFNLPAADRRGNLYATHAATVGDALEIARAAKRHGGLAIANVGLVVEPGRGRVFLPARSVDAIVVDPGTEQTPGFSHRAPWLALTAGRRTPVGRALGQARVAQRVGELTGGLARRTPLDEALLRLAAATLAAEVPRGARVAIGTGLPEQLPRVVFEHGRLRDYRFLVESGAIGGLPLSGVYFGASVGPEAIVSPAEVFRRVERRLDAACLGALEVDARGDVNVSRRGPGARGFVGPGGFMDFTAAARTIVFVSHWMRGGRMGLERGEVRLRRRGRPKLVARVREVTFDAARALRAGKRVLYVTPVGVFRLTARGLELAAVMPGVDVRRDVLRAAPGARIRLPASGEVPVVPRAVATGAGFSPRPTGRAPRGPGGAGRTAAR
jgi:propionate CoA-transferase